MLFAAGAPLLFITWNTLAQAPAGEDLGIYSGRSIAQIQEEDFDRRLNRYRHCYGVQVSYENASEGRRRACKALVVHKIGKALEAPGAYFNLPLSFECQNTGAGFTQWYDWKSNPVLKLKPNQEYEVIEHAIENYLKNSFNAARWSRAQEACDFYLECRDALSFSKWNFRNLKRCFWKSDSGVATRILQQELISSVFNKDPDGLIVPRMLEEENL